MTRVSYRPPTDPPKGKWAKAIHAKRRADDISQTGLFELLGTRLGFAAKSRTAFRAIDRGDRQPTEGEARVLAEWLGAWPADEEPTIAEAPDLAAAIVALTAELAAMRLEREAMRQEREAWRRGVAEAIRGYEGGLVPRELLDALAPRLPEDARP